MSTSYSPDTLIIDTADPSEVDRINDDLQHKGNGRPLSDPLPIGDGRLVVRVTLDPARARTLVDAVRPEGAGRDDSLGSAHETWQAWDPRAEDPTGPTATTGPWTTTNGPFDDGFR